MSSPDPSNSPSPTSSPAEPTGGSSAAERNSEAVRLYRKASEALAAGNYAQARDGFQRVVDLRRGTGDRSGEAAAWHQLASVALKEGDYAAASQGFRQALDLAHAVGDKAGEAATLHQVGFVAWNNGRKQTGMLLVAIGFILLPGEGGGDELRAMQNLAGMAGALGFDFNKLNVVLGEASAHYDTDGGRSLVDEAFAGL